MTKIREVLNVQPDDVQKQWREGTKSIADLSKQLHRAMQPLVDVQTGIQAIRVSAFRVPQFNVAVKRIIDGSTQFARTIENFQLGSIGSAVQRLAQLSRHNHVLDSAGWLPHYTTPFEYIDECDGDIDEVQAQLWQYYQDCWRDVRQTIELRLTSYDIDGEAKATFREALDAHEAGLYRCVCRVLLPEIERIARIELHESKIKGIASQLLLQELAGTLKLSSVEPRGWHGLNLLRRLRTHLYERINDEASRQRFEQDPVPNRHAAVHGLVIYSSMQNSLNSIFITEYIFQVISFAKKTSREPAAVKYSTAEPS